MSHYDIRLDDKFGSLPLIDIPGEVAAHEPWFNQTGRWDRVYTRGSEYPRTPPEV